MLRIAKSSPGVLDLSAVKDEFGLPVVLNGASHRDVPDHEEDNPILRRVRDMQWVTVTHLPIDGPEEPSATTVPPVETTGNPASSEVVPPAETTGEQLAPGDQASSEIVPPAETTGEPVVASEPPVETIDDVAKADGPKAGGKSDARRAGRRP